MNPYDFTEEEMLEFERRFVIEHTQLPELTLDDTPDFFVKQPIYSKRLYSKNTMNNKMENKMENGKWQDEINFTVKCEAHSTPEEIATAMALVERALELYREKAEKYPVFAHFYHEKYLEYEEGKLTIEDMIEIMIPDTPTNYEELYDAAVKVEPMLGIGVEQAENALRMRCVKAFKKKVINELCAPCPYVRGMIEWKLRDFIPEEEETRPMVVCKTCHCRFPYGSADGNCDACQITERTKHDNLVCKCCLRKLNEAEQVMVGKLRKIRDLCDDTEKAGARIICLLTDDIPEEAFEKHFFSSMNEVYRIDCESVKTIVASFRENLGNLKPQRIITCPEQLIIYVIRDHLENDTPLPFITREMYKKIEEKIILKQKIKEQIIEKNQLLLELEAKKQEAKKTITEAKKAIAEIKKAAAKEKSKSAFNPPEYPPAHKIKCKGSAQMVSNAPAQRAWLEKWAKDAWNGKDLWSAKTAKQYVTDKKNGVGTIFATAVVVEAVIFDGVEAEPIED
jgi:hypothetical protein